MLIMFHFCSSSNPMHAFVFFLEISSLTRGLFKSALFNFLAPEYFAIVFLLLLSALTPLLLENTLCSFNNFRFFLLLLACRCQHFEADLYGQHLVGLCFFLFLSSYVLKHAFT